MAGPGVNDVEKSSVKVSNAGAKITDKAIIGGMRHVGINTGTRYVKLKHERE